MPEVPRNVPDGVVTAPMAVLAPGAEAPLQPTGEPKIVLEFFYQESVPPAEVLRPQELPAPFLAPGTPVPTPPSQPPA
jgi:hypothetical protein